MFFGHTRFSLFNPRDASWRASNGSRFTTIDEYREYLFSEDRLRPRMTIFTQYSLPQLATAAKNHRLSHIVSYSAQLPQAFKDELTLAAKQFPFLVLDEQTSGQPAVTVWDLAAELRETNEPFAHYRLDDDDLLPIDYFDHVSRYVTRENSGMMVSLGSGVTALYIDGEYYNVRSCYLPMIAIGLLSICRWDEAGNLIRPVQTPHNLSDRSNPVILDSRSIGYLWTRHINQDSQLGWGIPERERVIDVILKKMEQFPASTQLGEVNRSFPVLNGVLNPISRPAPPIIRRIVGSFALSNEPIQLALDSVEGAFTLAVQITSPNGDGANNAILSLELRDEEGREVTPEHHAQALANAGVKASVNPEVGFFIYLPVAAGTERIRRAIKLPPGISLVGVRPRRYRHRTLDISITAFEVEGTS